MTERSLVERNKLVENNMRLVYRLANDLWGWAKSKYVGEFDDLVSEGMIGLINAAKAWDDSKGIKFSSFAYSCIKNEMIDAVRKGGVIYVPSYFLKKAKQGFYEQDN
jgi:RNA polymerase sigma factor (sigma-70 family)